MAEITTYRARAARRLVAAAIDAILVVGFIVLSNALDEHLSLRWRYPAHATYSARVVVCLLASGYLAVEMLGRRTLGHRIMGLRVAMADGSPASGRALALRWAARSSPLLAWTLLLAVLWLDWLPFRSLYYSYKPWGDFLEFLFLASAAAIALGMLGCFLPARRTLHDWISGTAIFHSLPPLSATGFEPILVRR